MIKIEQPRMQWSMSTKPTRVRSSAPDGRLGVGRLGDDAAAHERDQLAAAATQAVGDGFAAVVGIGDEKSGAGVIAGRQKSVIFGVGLVDTDSCAAAAIAAVILHGRSKLRLCSA